MEQELVASLLSRFLGLAHLLYNYLRRDIEEGLFMKILIVSLTLMLVAGCGDPAAREPAGLPPLEQFEPDYSNLRGLNYIASYAPSDVAMWRLYDSERIDRELGYIKSVGANNVRVWLAWVVYDVEKEGFVAKFKDFLGLARRHGLSVMPILWDSCFGDARASYEDLDDWVANPGYERVQNPAFRAQGDEYVRALIEGAYGDPTVAMWDIMNEPAGEGIQDWLEHYAKLVKSLDPDRPITIGWAHAKGNEATAAWVDVLSYHPYGIFDRNREVWTESMREISARHGNKPIIANEVGGPGFFQAYEDVIAFFAPRNIGFSLFEASIGSTRFKHLQGFFFPDGSVRDREGVEAFMAHARSQGAVADRVLRVKTADEQGYVPSSTAKTRAEEVVEILLRWEEQDLSEDRLHYYTELLRWTYISLAWGGGLEGRVEEAVESGKELDEATQAGDVETVRAILTEQALLARDLLKANGFI